MDASMYQDKEAKVGSYSFGDALLIDTGPEAALSAPSWVARVTSVCLKCHFAGYRGVGDNPCRLQRGWVTTWLSTQAQAHAHTLRVACCRY